MINNKYCILLIWLLIFSTIQFSIFAYLYYLALKKDKKGIIHIKIKEVRKNTREQIIDEGKKINKIENMGRKQNSKAVTYSIEPEIQEKAKEIALKVIGKKSIGGLIAYVVINAKQLFPNHFK